MDGNSFYLAECQRHRYVKNFPSLYIAEVDTLNFLALFTIVIIQLTFKFLNFFFTFASPLIDNTQILILPLKNRPSADSCR
jgi:hypothetical protein